MTIDGWLVLGALVVPALQAAIGQIFRIFWARHQTSAYELQKACREPADALLIALSNLGLDVPTLGVSVWRLHKGDRMTRPLRHRPTAWPPESSVKWGPGKGITGMAIVRKRHVFEDLRAFAAKWGDVDDPERINKVAKANRMNLSNEELCEVAGKYAEVVAVPIIAARKVIGVLALDRPNREGLDPGPQLGRNDVRDLMEGAAQHLARCLASA